MLYPKIHFSERQKFNSTCKKRCQEENIMKIALENQYLVMLPFRGKDKGARGMWRPSTVNLDTIVYQKEESGLNHR